MMALQTLAHTVGRAADRSRDEEGYAPVSIDLIHEGDAIVTREGRLLGTVDGLYEGGRWHHHLLVVSMHRASA